MGDRLAKPDPNLTLKYETTITTTSALVLGSSCVHLVAGGLSTLWFTSVYVGALASIFSIFSTTLILLLHKYKDDWRKTLRENVFDGTYPPASTLMSILFNFLIVFVWYIAAVLTIGFHALSGRPMIAIDAEHFHGVLPTWVETVFILCTSIGMTFLVGVQLVQRRITSYEMKKAAMSSELEY